MNEPTNDITTRIRNRIHDAPLDTERLLDDALAEIEKLRALCSEAYQAVGMLASMAGSFEDDAVDAVLTNLSDAAEGRPLTHESVIPFYPVGWAEKIEAADG